MRKTVVISAIALSLLAAAPAFAGASKFAVANESGADIKALSIRRVGTTDWQPLGVSINVRATTPVRFANQDCAFDLSATLSTGATVIWAGVNLCDVKLVTLNRNAAGLVWVDYD